MTDQTGPIGDDLYHDMRMVEVRRSFTDEIDEEGCGALIGALSYGVIVDYMAQNPDADFNRRLPETECTESGRKFNAMWRARLRHVVDFRDAA